MDGVVLTYLVNIYFNDGKIKEKYRFKETKTKQIAG